MRITNLIKKLEHFKNAHGDLNVIGKNYELIDDVVLDTVNRIGHEQVIVDNTCRII